MASIQRDTLASNLLIEERDKYLAAYQRGILTQIEVVSSFAVMLTDALDDQSAVELCIGLPDWFSVLFSQTLKQWAKSQYDRRWLRIGDSRTTEEIRQDELRRQDVLLRIVPTIEKVLSNTPSKM